MVEPCLLLQEGYPVFQIRKLDISDHSPGKSTHQPSLESWNLCWWAVARQHDLAARFIEGVERVEKLFLCCFLVFQELNIVDEKQVCFPVSSPEIRGRATVNRCDQLVRELFGTDEDEAGFGLALENAVRDCLHQVGFPQPGISVEKKGVVRSARSF